MINLVFSGARSFITEPNRVEMYGQAEGHVLKMNDIDPIHGIIGMAEGWDEVGAKICFRNNIPYTCIIPNMGYGRYYWQQHSLLKVDRIGTFNQLVAGATQVIYLEEIYGPVIRGGDAGVHGKLEYAPGYIITLPNGNRHWQMANFLRNEEMVVRGDRGLIYKPESSGTSHAVERFKAHHKPMSIFPDCLGTLF